MLSVAGEGRGRPKVYSLQPPLLPLLVLDQCSKLHPDNVVTFSSLGNDCLPLRRGLDNILVDMSKHVDSVMASNTLSTTLVSHSTVRFTRHLRFDDGRICGYVVRPIVTSLNNLKTRQVKSAELLLYSIRNVIRRLFRRYSVQFFSHVAFVSLLDDSVYRHRVTLYRTITHDLYTLALR